MSRLPLHLAVLVAVTAAVVIASCTDDASPDRARQAAPRPAGRDGASAASVDELLAQARAAEASGDDAVGIERYNAVLARRPDHLNARLGRANALARTGRHQQAQADFDHAVGLAPEDPEVFLHRATFHQARGRLDQAMADTHNAVALARGDLLARATAFRANLHLAAGNADAAVHDCTSAIEIDPDTWQAWQNRALALQRQGKLEYALRDYHKTIELRQAADAFNNRGALYVLMEKPVEALRDFSRAIQLDPGFVLAWDNRGVLHLKQGNADEAIRDFSAVIRLAEEALARRADPAARLGAKMSRVFAFRAQAHLLRADLAAAEADIAAARRIDPFSVEADHAARRLGKARPR